MSADAWKEYLKGDNPFVKRITPFRNRKQGENMELGRAFETIRNGICEATAPQSNTRVDYLAMLAEIEAGLRVIISDRKDKE